MDRNTLRKRKVCKNTTAAFKSSYPRNFWTKQSCIPCLFQWLLYEEVIHALNRNHTLYTTLFRGDRQCYSVSWDSALLWARFHSLPPVPRSVSDQFLFLLKVFFFYFCQKKRIKERKEGSLSLWNQILHPLQKRQCCQMSTFLWPQSNIWPEDSRHVESCSDAVGYGNLDPLKRRDSWAWFWIK